MWFGLLWIGGLTLLLITGVGVGSGLGSSEALPDRAGDDVPPGGVSDRAGLAPTQTDLENRSPGQSSGASVVFDLVISETGNQLNVAAEMPTTLMNRIHAEAMTKNYSVGPYLASEYLELNMGLIAQPEVQRETAGKTTTLTLIYRGFAMNENRRFRATVTDGTVNVLIRNPVTPSNDERLEQVTYRLHMPSEVVLTTADVTVGRTAVWYTDKETSGLAARSVYNSGGNFAGVGRGEQDTTAGTANSADWTNWGIRVAVLLGICVSVLAYILLKRSNRKANRES